MRLIDKVALVTGGGSGIGQAICRRFAEQGARIAVADLDLKNASSVADDLNERGNKAMALRVDVKILQEVKLMVGKVLNEFNRIDILVNSAGISKIISFLNTTEEIWDEIMSVNLKGTFLCCQAVIPIMLKQGGGKIINLSSKTGKSGTSWHAAYCASKAGIIGLTQSLAVEFASNKIYVNAICPGIVFTPIWDDMLAEYGRKRGLSPEQAREYLISKIPLGRPAEPFEVANLALFLASSESDYMTGQAINLTGGQEFH
jgi:sorbitol-6-phosphate 2-dehydrogenase